MEKVWFVLCIPAERDDDTENIRKNRKDDSKSTVQFSISRDSDGRSAASTNVDAGVSQKEVPLPQPPEDKTAAQDSTTVGVQQASLKREESSTVDIGKTTSPEQTDQSFAAQKVPEEVRKEPAASCKKSSVNPEAETRVSEADNAEQEIHQSGKSSSEKTQPTTNDLQKKADKTSDTENTVTETKEDNVVRQVSLSTCDKTELSARDTEDTFENGSPLITKKRMEEMLHDDFWDFGPTEGKTEPTASDKSAATTPGDDATTVAPPEEQENAGDAEEFVTCPSTPLAESSRKGQTPDKETKPAAEEGQPPESSVLNKFTTVPVPDSAVIESAVNKGQTDGPDKEIKPATEELQPPGSSVLNKFTTVPVPDSAVIEPAVSKEAIAAELSKGSSAALLSAHTQVQNKSGVSLSSLGKDSDPGKNLSSLGSGAGSDEYDDATELIDFLPKVSMRMNVRNCLVELGVKNVAWQKCVGDKVWQVTFVENAGVRCEDIMLKLAAIGVGRVVNSSISVIPVAIHTEKSESEEALETKDADYDKFKEKAEQFHQKTSDFQKSIKSRLVVRQVVKSVESNAKFTFDYLMLIILASVIAAVGLVENSSVVLVASMLISPLMGPILAGTFGAVIKNNKLRNLGIRSELCGLGICLLCGFLCGLVAAGLETVSHNWRNTEEWPTKEMSSRGVARGLLVGILIAIPSGAGVALSVLGGNTGSLVGVAISASLLPPAVNAGMLWSSALLAAIAPPAAVTQTELRNFTEIVNGTKVIRAQRVETVMFQTLEHGLACPEVHHNEYVHTYSCDYAIDYAILGTVSLLLTFLNIVCIFIMGVIVLKIKEVAPRTSTDLDKNFFKTDIKVARDSYTTTKGPQSAMMGKKWLEEYKAMRKQMELKDFAEEEEIEETMDFQQILQSLENSAEVRGVLGRIPCPQETMSQEVASELQKKVAKYMETHPELGREYHTVSYVDPKRLAPTRKAQSVFTGFSPVPPPLLAGRAQSAYFMGLSPMLSGQPSAFVFPPHYSPCHPETPSSPSHERAPLLAPVLEEKESDEDEDSLPKRRLRLHIPKKFFVTPLSETRSKESYKKIPEKESGSESAEENKEQDQETKHKQSSQSSPRKGKEKSAGRLTGIDEGETVPLSEIQSSEMND